MLKPIRDFVISLSRVTGTGVLAAILLFFGTIFIQISAFLSAGSANGFLEGGNTVVQWGGTILMGSLIIAAFGAQQVGRPVASMLFTIMSIFFAQASLNAGWKYAEVESLKAEAQIQATIKTIGLQADDSAATIQAKEAMAAAVKKAAENLDSAERRFADAKQAMETNTPPQPSAELQALRADLSTARARLECETLGPQNGASECRGKDGVIIRTTQKPGPRAAALRDQVDAIMGRIGSLEADHQAAMNSYREWLDGSGDGLADLEADVIEAREAMTTANANLAALATAPKPVAPVAEETRELELTQRDGAVEEFAFPDDAESGSDYAAWIFGEMFQSSEFHWGSVAGPAIEHNLGLSDMRIAATAEGASPETIKEYKRAKEFRVGLLFWAVAASNDLAALLCLAAGLQLLGVQPKKRKSRGALFVIREAIVETLWGTSATVKGRMQAAQKEAQAALSEKADLEAKLNGVQERMEKDRERALVLQDAEIRAAMGHEIEALRAQVASLEAGSADDPFENPNLIPNQFDAGFVARLKDKMNKNPSMHARVMDTRRIKTSKVFPGILDQIKNGTLIVDDKPPRRQMNAAKAYVETMLELQDVQDNIRRLPNRKVPLNPVGGAA